MKVFQLARILPAAVLACLASASAAHSSPVPDITPDKPEGHWTGTLQCARDQLGCVDTPVMVDIAADGHDLSYTAKLTYTTDGAETSGPSMTFYLKPELHTISAHYRDFADRQFWAMKLDGDTLGGVRLINESHIDRFVYLTRDKQP